MGDRMTFPATFDEFAEHYKIVDKQEIYTNGTELIPIFRVKQWLENADVAPRAEVIEAILSLIDDKIRFEVEVYNGFHSAKSGKTLCQERVNALNDIKLIINYQFRTDLKMKHTEKTMENKLALKAKYTDDDVIKAAECCAKFGPAACNDCPFKREACSNFMVRAVSDLLKRQKAELERLRMGEYRHIGKTIVSARNEAFEDFATRAKEKMQNLARMQYGSDEIYFLISESFIDNLVKEMTEARNER